MERYPFLTLKEHKILQSQQEFKAIPYRKLTPKVSKYLKNMKQCKHDGKYIFPHYCQYHMKNVVVCDLCHAERLPTPLFIQHKFTPTNLQKQKVAHDWFL